MDWLAAGGRYIGLACGGRAVDFSEDRGLLGGGPVDCGDISGSAIVRVDHDPDGSIAGGFNVDGFGFVYGSVWFTDWPADAVISARLDGGASSGSGFWEDRRASGASGMPVVIHTSEGTADVPLIGNDCTFGGRPRDTARILGNAICDGLE